MYVLTIAHDGHIGQLIGAALSQESDGRRYVLQIHTGIKQLLGYSENHHILKRV